MKKQIANIQADIQKLDHTCANKLNELQLKLQKDINTVNDQCLEKD
jgi:hypothetical protein